MAGKAGWIVLSSIVLLGGLAKGQPLSQSGVKAGLNISALHSSLDLDTSPRFGYHAGLYYRRMLAEKITFRAEIFYSQEGQVYDSISLGFPVTFTGVASTTTIHKLCTPVLIEVGRKLTVDMGAQIGWMLAADNTMSTAPALGSARRDMKDQMAIADLSVVGGLGFHPPGKFEACIRYNHGLSRILEPFPQHPAHVQFRSRVLQVTVGYLF